ncbi:Adenosine (5')-pentaphospho-(5'')-adenosine pyrophosphohydrolase [invertebrate metagenome]|uniref:Adenosine (5')-pentaphospho-(5'')-adenosine pyrophosphohydrolase n=1 Tax=invertebrate metagenome TaxID=1711999 RepID=A0A484H4R9_9ZZZZ
MTMDNESRPYRLGVGIILVNKVGQVFVGQRIDTDQPAWQMPQGGIEEGEDPRAAALRELHEEVGTDKVEVITETADWAVYDLPAELACTVWNGRYRGQKQKWYVMRFTGSDTDINITSTRYHEFSKWQWMDIDMVLLHIINFKYALYKLVIDELRSNITSIENTIQ